MAEDEKEEEVVFNTADDGSYYASPDRGKVFFDGSVKYVCFSVQAMADAHIGLFPDEVAESGPVDTSQPFYEFVFGTKMNTLSAIRREREGENKAQKKGPIVSIREFRELWVSVDTESGRVAAGRGHDITLGAEMEFKDEEGVLDPVNFAFMTMEGSPGGWKFKDAPEAPDVKPRGPLPPYELVAEPADEGKVMKKEGLNIYQTGPVRTGAAIIVVSDLCGWRSGRTRAVADYLGRVLCAMVVVPSLLDNPCFEGGVQGDGVPMGFDLHRQKAELTGWMMKYVWDSFRPKIEAVAAHLRNGGAKRIAMVGLCFGAWIACYATQVIGDLVCCACLYPSIQLLEEEVNRGSVPRVAKYLSKVPATFMTAGNSPDQSKLYAPGGDVFEANKAVHGNQTEYQAFPRMPHGWVVRAHHNDKACREGAELAVLETAKYLRKYLWPAPKGADAASLRLKAKEGDTDAVETLLASGLAPGGKDAQDALGLAPLHYVASSEGSVQAVKVLVEWEADVNAAGGIGGETPLHVAARAGKSKAVKILLQCQADPEVRDKAVQTPLHLAAKIGAAGICEMLLCYQGSMDARDTAEQTPMHLAAGHGQEDVVRLLLKANMDVDPEDIRSKTPQQRAIAAGFDAVGQVLEAERLRREEEAFFAKHEGGAGGGKAELPKPPPPGSKPPTAGAAR